MRGVGVGFCFAMALLGSVSTVRGESFRFGELTLTVPDGFIVERVAGPPLVERPVTLALDEAGRLYVADSSGSNAPLDEQRSDPRHRIVRLEDTDADGTYDACTPFADRLTMLQGTCWHEGSLFVAAVPDILALTDTDGDGTADERRVWLEGQTLGKCGNDVHGPYRGPDRWFYWTKGAWGEQTHDLLGRPGWKSRAPHVFRARPDGSRREVVLTGGMDNPVDVAFLTTGERLLSATFLEWPAGGRRDGVVHAVYGGLYGKDHAVLDGHERTGDLLPVLVQMGPAAASGLCVHSGYGLGDEFRDNAFVCGFNLRTVSRHVLVPDGGTYATVDSPFLTGDSADFHPTDVIEDADGSLLVVDTGGWYKLCCPTSQLAKPAVLGGIYRVRRCGPRTSADPRGAALSWDTLDGPALAQLLADPRPAVAARAADRLVRLGDAAVPAIGALGDDDSTPARGRQNAVWTLSRLDGSPAARAAVRAALADPAAEVRHAAALACGLNRDPEAVAGLSPLLADERGVARAAAEALGRIGGREAVDAILAACARAHDRVFEHSLTYALIESRRPEQLLLLVDAADPGVRRAVLVALDQMASRLPAAVLPREALLAACRSEHESLREAAMLVASGHPEWADALTDVIRAELGRMPAASPDTAEKILARLTQLAAQPAGADALAAACCGADSSTREAALRVMRASRIRAAPDSWIEQIVTTIERADAGDASVPTALRTLAALPLTAKQRTSMRPWLMKIAADHGLPVQACLAALQVAGAAEPLPDEVVERLFDLLATDAGDGDVSPLERSAAAGSLATTPLSDDSLARLAGMLPRLPGGDVSGLLPRFTSRGGGLLAAAITAIADHPRPEAILREPLAAAVAAVEGPEAEVGRRLLERVDRARAVERESFDRLAASLPPGDPSRGHRVFTSTKAACTTCHAMAYVGGRVGPDLTKIGSIRTSHDLLEAIVLPSASFVRSYEPVTVITTEGRVASGIIREETVGEIVVQTNATTSERIPREAIESIEPGTVSLMPKGYDTLLSPQDLADLVAFLARAK